jgi:hypothetical protein
MHHSSINLAPHRPAARAAARIRRWPRRPSGRRQAGDSFARHAGWAITRTRFGGRIYRDPRFSQPPPHLPPGPRRDPPPPGGLPAARDPGRPVIPQEEP